MKLIELAIKNIRGIRDVVLYPRGENYVVWGPNGSGKSAVIDAIDFLLTGNIARLTGDGAGDLSLAKHGPNVNAPSLEEATVRAVVLLPGMPATTEIRRSMARPGVLECDESVALQMTTIETLARRGQHVLTRRDILRFVTAVPRTRAQMVQDLMNLSEVETTRQTLVRVENDLKRSQQEASKAREAQAGRVAAAVGERRFDPEKVLAKVNAARAQLGGAPIATPQAAGLRVGVTPATPVSTAHQSLDIGLLRRHVDNLRRVMLPSSSAELAEADLQLREALGEYLADQDLRRALSHKALVTLGLALIGDEGSCPLCDVAWDADRLRGHLNEKLLAAERASAYETRVKELMGRLLGPANAAAASIEIALGAVQQFGLEEERKTFGGWLAQLRSLLEALTGELGRYLDLPFTIAEVSHLLMPSSIPTALDRILAAAEGSLPKLTPEQEAWDQLTRLEVHCRDLDTADGVMANATLSFQRAAALHQAFLSARDAILGQLYNEIRDDFVTLYRSLHDHEPNFVARFEPDRAGLNMEVDFYGRGLHPPHALHSEGHQDSMGICLYLALAEKLTKHVIDLVLLDDVVMSVDADHRREVCAILSKFFPHRQFMITTHDRSWSYQLRTEGVVKSKHMINFHNWHVETGPMWDHENDLWNRIASDIASNDIPAAAGRLRRGLESFFTDVCDRLEAEVVFKLSHRWELAELIQPAMSQYKNLIREGKKAASSWKDDVALASLKALEDEAGKIFAETQAEQWAINVNVHYNNWANFNAADFTPVVEAFRKMCDLYQCSHCESYIAITYQEIRRANVRCHCGRVNWNLIDKK